MQKLLKLTNLGSSEIETYVPNSEAFKYGVISPVDFETDLTKLKDNIKLVDERATVVRVERLKGKIGGEWVDSKSIKITFASPDLPDHLKIFHSYYAIRPFIPHPVQCFRCQRMGHNSLSCKSRIRCLLCGLEHVKELCKSVAHKCANCKLNHIANSKECTYIKQAKEIQYERITKNISYKEARDKIIKNNISPIQQPDQYPVMQNRNVKPIREKKNFITHIIQADVHH